MQAISTFRQAIANCIAVFGDDAFKLKKDAKKKANRSAPYADAVMQALADHPTDLFTPETAQQIRSALEELCMSNADFRNAVEKGTNGESAIRNRITLARAAVDAALKGGKTTATAKAKKRPSTKQ